MSEEELLTRLRILSQKLEIYRIYHDELVQERGVTFLHKRINEALDEIILRRKQLQKIKSKKK